MNAPETTAAPTMYQPWKKRRALRGTPATVVSVST
jgi:hypothetical protein